MSDTLKVGATLWQIDADTNAHTLSQQAEIAEALGYDSFWFSESHFSGPASIPAPLMALASVAARTTRIRLASTSYLLPIRNPLQAAEEVAVLDNLSGGRVILGIGRGFRDALFTVFDIPQSDKRKLFARSLKVMRQAWRGEPINGHRGPDGEEAVYLGPLPVQRPHPPLWVAAFGPLAIKQAATLGLPYLASPMESLEQLRENYGRHREVAGRAGCEPVTSVPVMRTLFVSRDRRKVGEITERLSTQMPRRGEALAPAEWAILGGPDEVAARIERYRQELGMTHLVVRGRIPGVSYADQVASLELLATTLRL